MGQRAQDVWMSGKLLQALLIGVACVRATQKEPKSNARRYESDI